MTRSRSLKHSGFPWDRAISRLGTKVSSRLAPTLGSTAGATWRTPVSKAAGHLVTSRLVYLGLILKLLVWMSRFSMFLAFNTSKTRPMAAAACSRASATVSARVCTPKFKIAKSASAEAPPRPLTMIPCRAAIGPSKAAEPPRAIARRSANSIMALLAGDTSGAALAWTG